MVGIINYYKPGRYKKDSKSNTGLLYIPAVIARDSSFPLKEGPIEIVIEDDHLIIHNKT